MKEPLWWALALLPLTEGSPEWRVRAKMQAATPQRVRQDRGLTIDQGEAIWHELIDKSYFLAERKPLEAWRQRAYAEREQPGQPQAGPIAQAVRHAALSCERAFAEICNLLDDEGEPIRHADFHVLTIRALRQESTAAVFLPLEHGKTYLSSIQVPLMDWAEWHNATEGRIYWNETHVRKWTLRLMDQVEFNRELQHLFPWIRRPAVEDRSANWGIDGFSIGGRTIRDRSFEPLTARGWPVGNRYGRPIADDWVNRGNCQSITEQNKLFDSFYEGVMTMPQRLKRASPYGTRWGTVGYVGTLYDRRDCGYRIAEKMKLDGKRVIRFDVYTDGSGNPDQVLWPEGRDAEWVAEKRRDMPPRSFNARYRNMVVDEGMETFSVDDVEAAVDPNMTFGKIPPGARAMIGFDPAAGLRTRHSADPAICVYAEVPDIDDETGIELTTYTAHFVAWERLIGCDFHKQCSIISNWAQRYMLPVVIEKNTLQGQYRDYLRGMAPDVKVYDHQTGAEKWDPDDGVETFVPLFANHRAVIHGHQAPHSELRALKDQLIEWPQVDKQKKDLLMAFWFARSKMRKRQRMTRKLSVVPDLPDYIDAHYWNTA